MKIWRDVLTALVVLIVFAQHPAGATEKLLKLRQYTFGCGNGQECVGWRHSFAFIDPAARDAELPRDAYVDLYTLPEIDGLFAKQREALKAELPGMIDDALAKRAGGAAPSALSEADRTRLRDDVAAEVVTQLSRMMAEREAQTRAWLQDQIRQELQAAGVKR